VRLYPEQHFPAINRLRAVEAELKRRKQATNLDPSVLARQPSVAPAMP
jgi:hypothetical protein